MLPTKMKRLGLKTPLGEDQERKSVLEPNIESYGLREGTRGILETLSLLVQGRET